jgi:hypothetical protein
MKKTMEQLFGKSLVQDDNSITNRGNGIQDMAKVIKGGG